AFLVTDFTLRIIWTALRNWWDNLAEGTQTFLSSISGCIQGRICAQTSPWAMSYRAGGGNTQSRHGGAGRRHAITSRREASGWRRLLRGAHTAARGNRAWDVDRMALIRSRSIYRAL